MYRGVIRVVSALLIALLSALFALLGTAGIAFSVKSVPLGLLLGISSLALFYLSIRLIFTSRFYLALSGAISFAVAIFCGRYIPVDQPLIWIWMASLPIICGTILAVPFPERQTKGDVSHYGESHGERPPLTESE